MKQRVVVIDPGHPSGVNCKPGSRAYGAIAKDGTEEHVLNYYIAQEAELYLKRYAPNWRVINTRNRLQDRPSLADRKNLSNKNFADVYVSIHCNANKSSEVQRVEAYYVSRKGLNLAKCIDNYLFGYIKKVKGKFYVLRKTKCPAVILECGYMTHRGDLSLLKDIQIQRMIGKAVALGIIGFLV